MKITTKKQKQTKNSPSVQFSSGYRTEHFNWIQFTNKKTKKRSVIPLVHWIFCATKRKQPHQFSTEWALMPHYTLWPAITRRLLLHRSYLHSPVPPTSSKREIHTAGGEKRPRLPGHLTKCHPIQQMWTFSKAGAATDALPGTLSLCVPSFWAMSPLLVVDRRHPRDPIGPMGAGRGESDQVKECCVFKEKLIIWHIATIWNAKR